MIRILSIVSLVTGWSVVIIKPRFILAQTHYFHEISRKRWSVVIIKYQRYGWSVVIIKRSVKFAHCLKFGDVRDITTLTMFPIYATTVFASYSELGTLYEYRS